MRRSVLLAAMAGVLVAVPIAVYAAHSFNDVPSTNTFHADIGWLKDTSVTKGCNPPANDRFCPDDFVTREQMAAFLRRLAEGRVVDAGTLDGLTGSEYGNPVATDIGRAAPMPALTATTLAELSIHAPREGGLIVTASVFGGTTAAGQPSAVLFWTQVDRTTCNVLESEELVMLGTVRLADDLVDSGSATGAVPVSAGPHTVTLCGISALGGVNATASLVAEYATSITKTGSFAAAGDLDLAGFLSP